MHQNLKDVLTQSPPNPPPRLESMESGYSSSIGANSRHATESLSEFDTLYLEPEYMQSTGQMSNGIYNKSTGQGEATTNGIYAKSKGQSDTNYALSTGMKIFSSKRTKHCC